MRSEKCQRPYAKSVADTVKSRREVPKKVEPMTRGFAETSPRALTRGTRSHSCGNPLTAAETRAHSRGNPWRINTLGRLLAQLIRSDNPVPA
jgi:hypothetical protein